MNSPLRVAIADDSPTLLDLLTGLIGASSEMKLVGVARDGLEAVELAKHVRPDILTMDVMMPRLDGLGATAAIMAEAPTRVLMVCAVSKADSMALSFRAIEAGALELIAKPAGGDDLPNFGQRVLEAIRLMSEVPVVSRRRASALPKVPRYGRRMVEAIGIAASTGGPPAIAQLVGALPELNVPIFVAQHMAPGFTAGFARWLSTVTGHNVEIASPGFACRPGSIYLAPDGHHLEVDRNRRLLLTPASNVGPFPSGNRLLQSLAISYGSAAMGIVLTGMGDDGAKGLLDIRKAGGVTLAQDAASSVVYGMPQAAAEVGATDAMLPPSALASVVLELCVAGSAPP